MGGRGAGRAHVLRGEGQRSLGAAALLAATLAAAPAAAVIKVATYTGTVTSGYDQTGEFGPANADLTGKTFVSRFVYDTSLGSRESYPGYYDDIYGGTETGYGDPILLATVSVGGATRSIGSSSYIGQALLEYGTVAEEVAEDYVTTGSSYRSNEIYGYLEYSGSTIIPTDLDTNFTTMGVNYEYGAQGVSLYSYIADSGTYTHYAYANADVETLTVTGGVPEPATWALMIGGFGAVGAAARRRRRVALA